MGSEELLIAYKQANDTQFTLKKRKKENHPGGFPGGLVVKNLPASAGDTGSIPVWEVPHAMEQLSPLCHKY